MLKEVAITTKTAGNFNVTALAGPGSPRRHFALSPLAGVGLLVLLGVLFFISQDGLAKEAVGISNYQPAHFVESAETPFFYSIGKQIKYGSSIDALAPSLFKGSWLNGDLVAVYPSPDNQKAAIVSNRKLYVIETGKPPLLALENVDHYKTKKMNDGDVYFKWPTLQWHPNSRFIYIVKDKGQTLSKEATLIRIDIDNIRVTEELISDFRSSHYFFVGSDSVCFNHARGDGSIIWKCSTAKGASRVRTLDDTDIHLDNGIVLTGQRFLSYKRNIYESIIWMTRYGFSVRQMNEQQDGLFHEDAPDTPLLTFKTERNIKGHRMNGIKQTGGTVLPGGRFLLLNMASEGQILLDRVSGHYRKLPKDTQVYRNLNSTQYPDFAFSINNPLDDGFIPKTQILP